MLTRKNAVTEDWNRISKEQMQEWLDRMHACDRYKNLLAESYDVRSFAAHVLEPRTLAYIASVIPQASADFIAAFGGESWLDNGDGRKWYKCNCWECAGNRASHFWDTVFQIEYDTAGMWLNRKPHLLLSSERRNGILWQAWNDNGNLPFAEDFDASLLEGYNNGDYMEYPEIDRALKMITVFDSPWMENVAAMVDAILLSLETPYEGNERCSDE